MSTASPNHEQAACFRRRLTTAARWQGLSVEGIARECKVSPRHLWYVVTGQRRPSEQLLAKVRGVLGEPAWAFATGQTSTLSDERGSHAAA